MDENEKTAPEADTEGREDYMVDTDADNDEVVEEAPEGEQETESPA